MYNKETHLSENFTINEMIDSPTAAKFKIPNNPSPIQWERIQLLVDNVLQPTRTALNAPITVNSVFRSKALNNKIKGSSSSQHMCNNGAAADIECKSLGNKALFDYIMDNIDFDQLIWEFGNKNNPDWVHVSYVSKEKNRKQVLKCFKDPRGATKYVPYKN